MPKLASACSGDGEVLLCSVRAAVRSLDHWYSNSAQVGSAVASTSTSSLCTWLSSWVTTKTPSRTSADVGTNDPLMLLTHRPSDAPSGKKQ